MGGTIASAFVEINSNIKALQKDIASIKGHVETSAKHMETRFNTATKAISAMGTAIATIGLAKFSSDIISSATKLDSLNRMLVNVEGSQTKANKRFEEFRRLAKEPVLDPMNLSKYYVALRSVGMEAERSIPFMKSLANAMVGVGAGNQQFALSMEQFVQMVGKGKVMGDDLRAIANSFPQIRKYLVEAFGTAIPEELEKKGLTAIQVMKGLNEQMEKAPKFAGGAQAAQDNFKQSLELFQASLGQAVLPSISEFLNGLTSIMDVFTKLPSGLREVIGVSAIGGTGLLGMATALKVIKDLLGPISTGLKEIAGIKAGMGLIPSASGLVDQYGKPIMVPSGGATAPSVGLVSKLMPTLGSYLPQIVIGTMIVASLAGPVADLIGKAAGGKPSTYIPSGQYVQQAGLSISSYPKELQEAYAKLQKFQLEAGNFPEMTFAEIAEVGGRYAKVGIAPIADAIKEFNLNYIDWKNKTFADLTTFLGLDPKGKRQYNVAAGPEPMQKLLIPYATNIPNLDINQILSGRYFSELGRRPVNFPIMAKRYLPMPSGPQPAYGYNIATGISMQRIPYTSEISPGRPSGLPREFTPGTGGLFGGQVSNEIQANAKANIEINKKFNMSLSETEALTKRIGGYYEAINRDIELSQKHQEDLTNSVRQWANYLVSPMVEKGVNQLFGKLFEEDDIKKAWKIYQEEAKISGEKATKSFELFSNEYKRYNDLNSQSWSDFCKNMVKEFAISLAKMEAIALTTDIYNYFTGKSGSPSSVTGQAVSKSSGYFGNISANVDKAMPLLSMLGIAGGVAGGAYYGGKTMSSIDKGKGMALLAGGLGLAGALGFASGGGWSPFDMFESGGIVTRPTIALIGEKGPEAVVPLSNNNGYGNTNITVVFPNADPNSINPIIFKQKVQVALRELRRSGDIS